MNSLPALHTDLQVWQKVQYEVEERFVVSHIPHSSSEICPCHLGKSGDLN